MNIHVRTACLSDIKVIYEMGQSDSAFKVSNRISFYERTELEEWISAPQDNLLLVLELEKNIIGFLFCKVMSHHWAMLDNFYINPRHRGMKYDRLLLRALKVNLDQRGIVYLSTLVSSNDSLLASYLQKRGFNKSKKYTWYEIFIKEANFKEG